MNCFKLFVAFAISVVALSCVQAYETGSAAGPAAEYELPKSAGTYGASKDTVLPYSANKANTVTSSISYPQNKGEILIHRPAAIIVKRPPTKVLVNHPPLVVKPAPVVLHKPPAVVLRKVFVKHHPRPVKVEPVYVNVVKPPAEKYFVNDRQAPGSGNLPGAPGGPGASVAIVPADAPVPSAVIPAPGATVPAGVSSVAAGDDGLQAAYAQSAPNAPAPGGYRLLPGNEGLAALAQLAQSAGEGTSAYAAPSSYEAAPSAYAAPSTYTAAPAPSYGASPSY